MPPRTTSWIRVLHSSWPGLAFHGYWVKATDSVDAPLYRSDPTLYKGPSSISIAYNGRGARIKGHWTPGVTQPTWVCFLDGETLPNETLSPALSPSVLCDCSSLALEGDHVFTFNVTSKGTPITISQIEIQASVDLRLPEASASSLAAVGFTQTAQQNTDRALTGAIVGGVLGGLSVICVTLLFYLYIKGSFKRIEKPHKSAELDKEFLLINEDLKTIPVEAFPTPNRPSSSSSLSSTQPYPLPILHESSRQPWQSSNASSQKPYEDPYGSKRPSKEKVVVLRREEEGSVRQVFSGGLPSYAP